MRRYVAAALAVLLLAGAMCACMGESGEQTEGLQLWFAAALSDESGWTGAAQAVQPTPYTGEENVGSVLAALLDGPPAGSTLRSPFPAGTEVAGWKRSGSILQISFTAPYGTLEGIDQTIADYCVALTLTQLEGVDGVRVSTEGGEMSRRILRREDVVFSGVEEEPVEVTAMLCFRRTQDGTLVAELRTFRLTENESAALAVLEALLAGPSESGLERLIPQGVEAYSARVDDGVCYADLSAELLEKLPADAGEQELILRSIRESLCSLSYVDAVQILVEGEPLADHSREVLPAQDIVEGE